MLANDFSVALNPIQNNFSANKKIISSIESYGKDCYSFFPKVKDINTIEMLKNSPTTGYAFVIPVGGSKTCNYSEHSISISIDLSKVENLNKIDKIALFNEDWDGNGAQPFSGEVIYKFKEILKSLNIQPQIAPTGRNSLLMQYELDDGSKLAFEVTESSTDMVLIPHGNYSIMETRTYVDDISQAINENVRKFYGFE